MKHTSQHLRAARASGRPWVPALALTALLLTATAARALINPNFSPVHLVSQAETILLLKIGPLDAKGVAKAQVIKVLKGKAGAVQTIDVTRCASAAHEKAIRKMLAADTWETDTPDQHMEATWAGGTDMLLKVVELLRKYPDYNVPVSCTGRWDEPIRPGKVAGKVGCAAAVDLSGKGKLALFVACDAGDRVFAHDAKTGKITDVTAALKLASKSAAAAWGDYNGDGRLDLASSDGKSLAIWTQADDGTFSSSAVAGVPAGGCLGLAALDLGLKGRPGLLWTSKSAAVLLVPDAQKAGNFSLKSLTAPPGALKDSAGPGPCLVADFDGDALADVIRPCAKGSLFFKGRGGADFADGLACPLALGPGRTGAFLGDFDADGRIDVLAVAADSSRLWQNAGGGKFADLFQLSGELSYISLPGGSGGNTCDLNADGRQDVFLYYAEKAAQVFFNRGYRSFGHAHRPIDIVETGNLPEAEKGQQAAVLADLNGDGAQDMALVLLDGSVVILPQAQGADSLLSVRVCLAPGAGFSGPLNVSAANDRRSLGAWTISPGASEALFARSDPGDITVTWQMPGGRPEKKRFTLEDKSQRLVIGK